MSEILGPDESPPVILSERAIIAVKEFMASDEVAGSGLRVHVQGGGCAGFQYGLDFSEPTDADLEFLQDGLRIFIDPISMMHLEGTMIDYVMGISGAGFKFNNPHATRTCGCGSSFS